MKQTLASWIKDEICGSKGAELACDIILIVSKKKEIANRVKF
jgi:hypothetical protein